MKYSRPYFDADAYAAGKHCGSGSCHVCGGTACYEYCETGGQCSPDNLEMWVALCNEHRATPLRNWRDVTDEFLHTIIDFHQPERQQ